jgi:uncharacterized protein
VKQSEAIGHAVRATYLYSGMADVAALTQNQAYIEAIHKIWNNAAGKKTYITGGIGSAGGWEGFGPDYNLPNKSAYCETCAGIGNVYWNHRMFMLTGDSKYIDLLERTLYNGILGGIGLDGKSFYYANPMEYVQTNGKLSGENKRSPWFSCSCCPSNICRFMPSMPGYIYARRNKELYINLFASSETSHTWENGKSVKLIQMTDYPWKGDVQLRVETSNADGIEFDLMIRIPGWAQNKVFPTDLYRSLMKPSAGPQIKLNAKPLILNSTEKGYVKISRAWKNGDIVHILFPMTTQKVVSHEQLETNQNLVSFQRGPLMYCAEFKDNQNKTSNLFLTPSFAVKETFRSDLLGGVLTLEIPGKSIDILAQGQEIKSTPKGIKLIPYYARSNRGVGEMKLWFPTKVNSLQIEHLDSKE